MCADAQALIPTDQRGCKDWDRKKPEPQNKWKRASCRLACRYLRRHGRQLAANSDRVNNPPRKRKSAMTGAIPTGNWRQSSKRPESRSNAPGRGCRIRPSNWRPTMLPLHTRQQDDLVRPDYRHFSFANRRHLAPDCLTGGHTHEPGRARSLPPLRRICCLRKRATFACAA